MSGRAKARNIIDGQFINSLSLLDLKVRETRGGRIGGSRKTNQAGSSLDWLDHRPYVQGDDLKYLDWNLFARFDQFFIKRYTDERQLHNNIYLDMSASMDWQSDEDKCRTALRLAVALGYLSMSHIDRISYKLLSGSRCRELCPPILDKDAFFRAASLLSTTDFEGDTDLLSSVQDDLTPGGDDGISVIISDLMTESDWKGAVDYLLSRKRQVVILQVLSLQETDPTYGGLVNLQDSECSGRRDMRLEVDRTAIDAYKQSVREWLLDIRGFCRSRHAACMQVMSDEKIEDIILKKAIAAGIVR